LKGGTDTHILAPLVVLVGMTTSVVLWRKDRAASMQESMCTEMPRAETMEQIALGQTRQLAYSTSALTALFQLHWPGHQWRGMVAANVTSGWTTFRVEFWVASLISYVATLEHGNTLFEHEVPCNQHLYIQPAAAAL